MPSIQLLPNGLLGLLQIKNGGQFPQELDARALLPVADLLPWYLEANSEQLAFTQMLANAVGNFVSANAIVPSKEGWWVLDYSCLATLVAAERIEYSVSVLFPQAATHLALGPPVPSTAAAGAAEDRIALMQRGRPFFAGPGTQFGAIVQQIVTGANIEIIPIIRFTRCAL